MDAKKKILLTNLKFRIAEIDESLMPFIEQSMEDYAQSQLRVPSDEEIDNQFPFGETIATRNFASGQRNGAKWLKSHLSNQPKHNGDEIEKYMVEKYSNSALKPEIIARRAVDDYINGLPKINKNKAVLDSFH